ncbi:MAG: group 1 truncated hemoglobin [Deltaproteobacteria bacterium]|nr:group 1 truncated hemoglobin [Deltaproteobacteria bacterium]MDQ3298631.1 group 1 truncated hemoglobin [Myxococcota bacterium]
MTLFATLMMAGLTGGCGGNKKADTTAAAAPADKSLYDRLGGLDAITAVVDDFVANVAADTRINAMFANADIKNLKAKLVEQICEATGGPCKYTGKSMKESHVGMNITEADFNALVEDLVKSLDKFKVPEKEKGELLGALGGMKGDIVTAQ